MKSDKYMGTIRILIGLMFLLIGVAKLMTIDGVAGFLGSLGFPAAMAFAWILALSETIFGLAVLVGYKVKYTAWPLIVIFAVAIVLTILPNFAFSSGFLSPLFMHLVVIVALAHFAMNGAGPWSIKK